MKKILFNPHIPKLIAAALILAGTVSLNLSGQANHDNGSNSYDTGWMNAGNFPGTFTGVSGPDCTGEILAHVWGQNGDAFEISNFGLPNGSYSIDIVARYGYYFGDPQAPQTNETMRIRTSVDSKNVPDLNGGGGGYEGRDNCPNYRAGITTYTNVTSSPINYSGGTIRFEGQNGNSQSIKVYAIRIHGQRSVPLVNNASCSDISAPSTVQINQTFSAAVVMRNTGTKPWTSNHRLGSQNPQDNLRWGRNRVNLPVSQVNPSQSVSFNFTVTAPGVAGTYAFDWKMLEENVEWFGATCAMPITVVTQPPPPPAILMCSPSTQTVAVNQPATLTGDGGYGSSGTYAWNAPSGNPASGGGTTFSTRYGDAGLKTITLSSSLGTAPVLTTTCTVNVSTGPPPPPPGTPILTLQKSARNVSQGQSLFIDSIAALQNETVEFRLEVGNSGTATINNVTLTDTLPVGITYLSGPLTVNWPSIAPGITYTVFLTGRVSIANPPASGTVILTNSAVASASNVSTLTGLARVVVSFNSPPQNPVTCFPLSQTAAIDQLVNLTASGGYGSSGTYAWDAPSGNPASGSGSSFGTRYAAAGLKTVTLSSSLGSSPVLTTTCTVNVGTTPPPPPPTTPGLTIAKDVRNVSAGQTLFINSVAANPGDQVEFRITVSAFGSTVNNVSVNDTLPQNFTLNSSTITFNLGNMAAGTQQTVFVMARAAGESAFPVGSSFWTNTAVVNATNVSSVSDTAVVVVNRNTSSNPQPPPPPPVNPGVGLSVMKDVRNVTAGQTIFTNSIAANPGDQVEFRIQLTNYGNTIAQNVSITDTLPSNFSLVTGTNPYNVGNLNPGLTATLNLIARVSPDANFPVGSSSWTNTATATASNASSVSDTAVVIINKDSAPVVAGSNVDLVRTKKAHNSTQNRSAIDTTAQIGDLIVYTLAVENRGNSAANNYVFEDDLADFLELSNLVDFTGADFDMARYHLKWQPVSIPAGTKIEKTFSVRVNVNNPNSDYVMSNIYGNQVNINVRKPQVAGVFTAPKTGGSLTLSFVAAAATAIGLGIRRRRNFFRIRQNKADNKT